MIVENYSDSETNWERFPDEVSYSFIHLKINSFIRRGNGFMNHLSILESWKKARIATCKWEFMCALKLLPANLLCVSIILSCIWIQMEFKSSINKRLEYKYVFKQLSQFVYMRTYEHASLLTHGAVSVRPRKEWWFKSIMYKLMLIFDSLLNYAVNPQNSRKRESKGEGISHWMVLW